MCRSTIDVSDLLFQFQALAQVQPPRCLRAGMCLVVGSDEYSAYTWEESLGLVTALIPLGSPEQMSIGEVRLPGPVYSQSVFLGCPKLGWNKQAGICVESIHPWMENVTWSLMSSCLSASLSSSHSVSGGQTLVYEFKSSVQFDVVLICQQIIKLKDWTFTSGI